MNTTKPGALRSWRDLGKWFGLGLVFWIAVIAIALALAAAWGPVVAHAAQPSPGARARAACPDVASCRAALARAYRGQAWQASVRRAELRRAREYGPGHALRLAAALYGVSLADMARHAQCESHLNPLARNRHSSAKGLFQFLDGTWTRAGLPGFSVFDPYANALAAARLVVLDGGWREWTCR